MWYRKLNNKYQILIRLLSLKSWTLSSSAFKEATGRRWRRSVNINIRTTFRGRNRAGGQSRYHYSLSSSFFTLIYLPLRRWWEIQSMLTKASSSSLCPSPWQVEVTGRESQTALTHFCQRWCFTTWRNCYFFQPTRVQFKEAGCLSLHLVDVLL